ncbi:MAG TPA: hypothetical protein VJH92_03425 [Candidatus Nanoarchaeia archaeon]|nr:hypothetical protein [Candidatus Nanoarchaeia archaeon]
MAIPKRNDRLIQHFMKSQKAEPQKAYYTSETSKLREDIKRIDNEIDELVYKIYGITAEEKKIIEQSLK